MEGLIPLWKEIGMTSHDCVFKLRKIVRMKKIGHSGTLDPDVDGVLPVALGKATKVIEYMMDSRKVYTGEITFGKSTTTEDSSGELIKKTAVPEDITEEDVDRVLSSFEGEITQIPPMYSAVKVKGKRLYEYAREGLEVERPSRQVTIHSFERTSPLHFDKDKKTAHFSFRVACSKGTYVRTLAVDTGLKFNLPSHMSQLTRVESSGFTKDQAFTLKEIEELFHSDKIEEALYPLETVLKSLPSYTLTDEEYGKVKNGSLLPLEDFMSPTENECVFYYKNQAVAIYGPHPTKDKMIKPIKVLRNELKV